MNFKKWVKSIQTAGYNGARTVVETSSENQGLGAYCTNVYTVVQY